MQGTGLFCRPSLAERVQTLLASAGEYDTALIFGTEALRRLPEQAMRELRRSIPGLALLSSEEEASACHISACMVAYMTGRGNRTVMSGDVGGGSFELCSGPLDAPGVLTSHMGSPLGSDMLQALYETGGIDEVKRAASAALASYPLTDDLLGDVSLFFSGSAATKLAWLIHRCAIGDEIGIPYEVNKVQGRAVTKVELEMWTSQCDRWRMTNRALIAQLVSPDNSESGELESFIASMQAMLVALEHTAQSRFLVNAYGARHGLAWLTLQGRTRFGLDTSTQTVWRRRCDRKTGR